MIKGNIAKNFDAGVWDDGEKQIVLDANTRKEAIANYREKYPDSPRSADAIGRRFYTVHPDKRDPKLPWSNEENQPILDAETMEEAVAGFQKLFPESKRTIPAIKRQWYELRPEMRGLVSVGRKKGIPNKVPHKGSARERYGIPMSTKQDPVAYNHGVYICTKYGKPYGEALKLEAADLGAKRLKKANKIARVPREKPAKKVKVAMPVREPKASVRVPVIRPVKAPDPAKTEAGFVVGQNVVHNGSNSSPYFGKVGKVVDILRTSRSTHLTVRFGPQTAIQLLPEFLRPASAAAATAGAGS